MERSGKQTHFSGRILSTLQRMSLTVLSTLAVVIMTESGLWLAGCPHEFPEVVAHPPNLIEQRKQLEFQYLFQTNSAGLRDNEITLQKEAGERRIFVAGDSFTEGTGVEADERFSNLLEQFFSETGSQVRFINGGLSGAGPLEYGNLFVKKGLSYQPDALLVCFYPNDVSNTPKQLFRTPFMKNPPRPRSRFRRLLHRFWPRINTQIEILQDARRRQANTVTTDFISTVSSEARHRGISETLINRWQSSIPLSLVTGVNQQKFNGSILSQGLLNPNYWSDSIDVQSPDAVQRWNIADSILSALVEHCRINSTEIAMVLLPSPFQCDPQSHAEDNPWVASGCQIRPQWLSGNTGIQQRLSDWTQQRTIPFLDLTEEFRRQLQSGSQLYWKLDGHLTPAGHRATAHAIKNWLNSETVFRSLPRPVADQRRPESPP